MISRKGGRTVSRVSPHVYVATNRGLWQEDFKAMFVKREAGPLWPAPKQRVKRKNESLINCDFSFPAAQCFTGDIRPERL